MAIIIGTPRGRVDLIDDWVVVGLCRRAESAGLTETVEALNDAVVERPASIPEGDVEAVYAILDQWITELGPAATPQGLSDLHAALSP